MKKLAQLFSMVARKREHDDGQFENRLRSMGKPQPGRRPTRAPKPVLFRRTVLQ